MKILTAQWTDADHGCVLAEIVNSRGETVNSYIPKTPPEDGGDWLHVEAWVAAGNEIAAEE